MSASSEIKLKEMLTQAGLPVKASYRPGEVCKILGISARTFYRLTERYEKDADTGNPVRPDSLDSYMISTNRRVRYSELVAFLHRNNTYRRQNALHEIPGQLDLFPGF